MGLLRVWRDGHHFALLGEALGLRRDQTSTKGGGIGSDAAARPVRRDLRVRDVGRVRTGAC